jgi:ribosomal protein S18 acetylase RimI-like enzyme
MSDLLTSKSEDSKIVRGSIDDLRLIYANFERDFPKNERKDLAHLEKLLIENKYSLILSKHKASEEIIGYALLYKNEINKTLWLDYLAIEEKYQSLGYGTFLFNKIIESEAKGLTGVFMEVEIPDINSDANYNNQIRREKFYERLGAKKLGFDYVLPTNQGGIPLNLYFKPLLNINLLSKEIIKDTIYTVFNDIHSDVKNRDLISQSFVNEINDVYFN